MDPALIREQIHSEIQRFESVHPSIYTLYDLIDLIQDPLIAQQIRHHVVSVEDSFVNSQEWTLSRNVPELRLGVLGSISSGKSALVHRYLTGTYMQEESPEGGRFKKEIAIEGSSRLLLIRDEGGPPDFQFSQWVDAVMFVFSLENEASFNTIYSFYAKLAHYRNITEVPLILVGTQDAISERQPRLIEEARAKKLASDLQRCSYYETCATYGLNVDKVFRDACQRIVQANNSRSGRLSSLMGPPPPGSCPTTPSHPAFNFQKFQYYVQPPSSTTIPPMPPGSNPPALTPSLSLSSLNKEDEVDEKSTPLSTPNAQRKTRRISNIFRREDDKSSLRTQHAHNGLGSGRPIPLKQGLLYKKSGKSLNKEWKKKYVALYNDGKLKYYPSLRDFMEDSHGKEIFLGRVTVKVPPSRPRSITANGKSTSSSHHSASSTKLSMSTGSDKDGNVYLTAFESIPEGRTPCSNNGFNTDGDTEENSPSGKLETPNLKSKNTKRHSRKGSGMRSPVDGDGENVEFNIVALDGRQWSFEAQSCEDRDSWVAAIQAQILAYLQGNPTRKTPAGDPLSLRGLPGNQQCADCGTADPTWASLNLGTLVCIDCSGIHRQLGSHISRVRSLELDQWPEALLSLMHSLGNVVANTVWESDLRDRRKPDPNGPREGKEAWIRAKYTTKDFLLPLPTMQPAAQQLFESVTRGDIRTVYHILTHAVVPVVNQRIGGRCVIHVACSLPSPEIAQLLVWAGADPDVPDDYGRHPSWYAESVRSASCVQILKDASAHRQ